MIKRIVVSGLAAVILVFTQSALIGAETPTVKGKLISKQLSGTIVAVDKEARRVTVDIKGTLIRVNVTSEVNIAKKGKDARFEDLAAGQSVTLKFLETTEGRIEVAAMSVSPNEEALQPAGKP